MADLFTIQNLVTLIMLVLLQAVLGFDNLLYISIESKRVAKEKQSYVRRLGIGLAIGLRIVLLFVLVGAIQYFQNPFWNVEWGTWVRTVINGHSLIVFAGGVFIIYTAFKEIFHMLSVDHIEHAAGEQQRSVGAAVFWIVLMNLVFSFDSILGAIALATDTTSDEPIKASEFWVMAIAIVISGLMMIWLADTVSEFLKKNRMYEVLGLFILLIVGVMLVSEGGELAHLEFFGYEIEAMSKATFYFVIAVLVLVDVVQSRYQKKLMAQRKAELAHEKV